MTGGLGQVVEQFGRVGHGSSDQLAQPRIERRSVLSGDRVECEVVEHNGEIVGSQVPGTRDVRVDLHAEAFTLFV